MRTLLLTEGLAHGSDSESDEYDDKTIHLRHDDGSMVKYELAGLSETCYDGTVIALVTLFDPVYTKKHGAGPTVIQFVFAMALHIFSVSLQFFLIYSLLTTTVKDREAPYKHNLTGMIAELRHAVQSEPPVPLSADIPLHKGALKLCSMRQCMQISHFLILFLWGTKMSSEAVDFTRRLRNILSVPTANWSEPLIEEQGIAAEGGKAIIYQATLQLKALFMVIICIPQFFAGSFLAYTGAKFLFFTGDMGTLVMKSVGLAFIVLLDELLFGMFASAKFVHLVDNSSFKFRASESSWSWEMWGKSILKVVCILAFTTFIWLVVFRDVTELRHLCDEYDEKFWDGSQKNATEWEKFLEAINIE